MLLVLIIAICVAFVLIVGVGTFAALSRGRSRQAVEPAALNLLTSASSGLARSLCLLCRAAWIEAASAGDQIIQPPHVQAAIERVPGAAGLLPSTAAAEP